MCRATSRLETLLGPADGENDGWGPEEAEALWSLYRANDVARMVQDKGCSLRDARALVDSENLARQMRELAEKVEAI